jgi:hypothetical protein
MTGGNETDFYKKFFEGVILAGTFVLRGGGVHLHYSVVRLHYC